MHIIKPPRLRTRDVIGVCAPASPPSPAEKIEEGIAYLERNGYRVEIGRNVFHRHGYLAGTDRQRATDLNRFFSDRRVKAIFTARGGYGSHRILPLLDYDLIRHNPKILVGYSDITAIQFALLAKIGMVTFSGPMVASGLNTGIHGHSEELFWQCLTSPKPPGPLLHRSSDERLGLGKQGTSTGRLLGGNLAVVAALLGSDYFPSLAHPILMLEEVGERPYRIDRMLQQIKLAGVLQRASGVALGRFSDCAPERGKPSLSLGQIFKNTFLGARYPVVSGFHYGHVSGTLTFPQGVRSSLDSRKGQLQLLEAGVS